MGLLDIFRRPRPVEPLPGSPDLRSLSTGSVPLSAHVAASSVTPEVAIRTVAILACVRFLSQALASMPLRVVRTLPDGRKEHATDLPCYTVLTKSPNSWQSRYEWVETLVYHTALYGNSYSLIVPSTAGGFCSALEPLHPSRMQVLRLSDGTAGYRYMHAPVDAAGGRTGWVDYRQAQILHVRWISDNSRVGMVPGELCATSVALARKLDQAAIGFWDNNARPDVVIETTESLNDEAIRAFRAQWREIYGGAGKRGSAAVLPKKATLRTIEGNSSEANEFSQLRRDIVAEVATVFGVPGTLVGVREAMKYSTTEQEHISAQVWCLLPWCCRLEGAIDRTVLTPESGPRYVGVASKLDNKGLMRGDTAARAAMYDTLAKWGAIRPEEMRDLEDLPELDEPAAKETYIQSGFVPLRVAADSSLTDAAVGTLMSIVETVATGGITASAAEALILTAYPTITPEQAKAIVAGAASSEPEESGLEPVDSQEPVIAPDTTIQEASLNGAQVTALLEILKGVGEGTLTADSAVSLITSAFPQIDASEAAGMVSGAKPPTASQSPEPPPSVEEPANG